jgi:cyclopropane fatty-acyl-phospholipid synthase-like methyltransferase
MARFPDISEFYDKEDNALDAHLDWVIEGQYTRQLLFLLEHTVLDKIRTVIEFGPGSGLLAHAWTKLRPEIEYLGIEKSKKLCDIACSRIWHHEPPPNVQFMVGDVRHSGRNGDSDLVVAFGLFKHIGLDEWDETVRDFLRLGRFAAFDVQLLGVDFDNGKDWHHTYVTEEHLHRVLEMAKHEEIDRVNWSDCDVEGHGRMARVALWTKRKK